MKRLLLLTTLINLKGEMRMNRRMLRLSRFLVVMTLILMPYSGYSSVCLAQASSSTLQVDIPVDFDFFDASLGMC